MIKQPETTITITTACTSEEKEAIYHFRYQIYVEELGKPLKSGKHGQEKIYDPLDDRSLLMYAQCNGEIVGTLRLTIGLPDCFSADLQSIFLMDQFSSFCNEKRSLCLSTKLAIKPEFRSSQLLYLIMNKAYYIYRESGVQFNFGGCNPYLLPLYEQMGFRRFTGNFVDPGYGMLIPLVMSIEDIEHFRQVRSPFYRIARRWKNDNTASVKFQETFSEELRTHINSQLITKDQIWQYTYEKLRRSPLTTISLLNGLTQEEASSLLHFGAMFRCTNGDCIATIGDVSNEVFVLLSGALVAEGSGARLIRPGECFGSAGFADTHTATETFTVLGDAELFVVPRQGLDKFLLGHPEAKNKIISNIKTLNATTGRPAFNATLGGTL